MKIAYTFLYNLWRENGAEDGILSFNTHIYINENHAKWEINVIFIVNYQLPIFRCLPHT